MADLIGRRAQPCLTPGGSEDSGRMVGNAEVIPVSPAAFSRGQNGLRTAVSGKLNLLKKTTFCDLRVSEFTSALSLVRGETGTTFRRLRIEETEAMNCTNRLRHWDEQQPKDLRDIRRAG